MHCGGRLATKTTETAWRQVWNNQGVVEVIIWVGVDYLHTPGPGLPSAAPKISSQIQSRPKYGTAAFRDFDASYITMLIKKMVDDYKHMFLLII